MKVIQSKVMLSSTELGIKILRDYSVVFKELIIDILPSKEALLKYPKAKVIDYSNYIISTPLCNMHIHLEFSANKSTLYYGSFTKWLKSIINNREELASKELIIEKAIRDIKDSGVLYLGEISSFAADFPALKKSNLEVILFNEILGLSEERIKPSIEFFLKRFHSDMPDNIRQAISIHSPYSINEKLYDFAIDFAKKNDLIMSTHYKESKDEVLYCSNKKSPLLGYLKNFTANPKPLKKDFLKGFWDIKTVFAHCVYVKDFSCFNPLKHSVAHCPVSNKLLCLKTLDINKVSSNINLVLGTDGLSSNISLNIFDEMRASLFMHKCKDLNKLSHKIYNMALPKELFFPKRKLEINNCADFAIFPLIKSSDESFILQFILHTKKAKALYRKGEEILNNEDI